MRSVRNIFDIIFAQFVAWKGGFAFSASLKTQNEIDVPLKCTHHWKTLRLKYDLASQQSVFFSLAVQNCIGYFGFKLI